ncbi:ferredoxin [Streptomyces sp. Y7]|uniref:ferredoxin n=1 Tax=Streptomyces sp. Y7 TaxID=3342392 RepID=UPI0037225CF3
MKVSVDQRLCEGYVNCVDAAPAVFEMNDHDKASVLVEHPGADVADAVKRAQRMCPVRAVIVEEGQ